MVRLGREPELEVPDERTGHLRVLDQRLVHVRDREHGGHTAPVGPIGAKDLYLMHSQAGCDDQAIERIGLNAFVPHTFERLDEPVASLHDVQQGPVGVDNTEVVDEEVAGPAEPGRDLFHDLQTEVLQSRHQIVQRQLPSGSVEGDAGQSSFVATRRLVLDPDQRSPVVPDLGELGDVPGGDDRRGRGGVVLGEAWRPLGCQHAGLYCP